MQAATANPLAGLDKVKDDMLKIINDAKQNQVLSFLDRAAQPCRLPCCLCF